jgi:hypothetical protein
LISVTRNRRDLIDSRRHDCQSPRLTHLSTSLDKFSRRRVFSDSTSFTKISQPDKFTKTATGTIENVESFNGTYEYHRPSHHSQLESPRSPGFSTRLYSLRQGRHGLLLKPTMAPLDNISRARDLRQTPHSQRIVKDSLLRSHCTRHPD